MGFWGSFWDATVPALYLLMTSCTRSVRVVPPPLAVTLASTVAVEMKGGRAGVTAS